MTLIELLIAWTAASFAVAVACLALVLYVGERLFGAPRERGKRRYRLTAPRARAIRDGIGWGRLVQDARALDNPGVARVAEQVANNRVFRSGTRPEMRRAFLITAYPHLMGK